jgi:hypothetical protein
MRVKIASISDFQTEESVDPCIAPYNFAGVEIRPSLTRHRNVIVTGTDWLPIQGEKVVLAVHTPELYLSKPNRPLYRLPGTETLVANTGPVRRLGGTSILVGGLNNYYHWFVEHLPRLLMARRVIAMPRVLINRPAHFQLESLARLGVHDIEVVDEGEAVMCDDLWIPSSLASRTVAHPAIPKLVREAFRLPSLSSSDEGKRVYLSRRDAASRRIENEAELEGLLAKAGFSTCVGSAMSFGAQVDLFSGTRVFLAAHGAGMANMLFCTPGAKIIEIYSPLHKVTSMQLLAYVCRHKHAYVPAENLTMGTDGNPLLGTWRVDLQGVREALDSLDPSRSPFT